MSVRPKKCSGAWRGIMGGAGCLSKLPSLECDGPEKTPKLA